MARWFRFYDDAMDDPKVLMLSDAHYRAWTNLLCVASKNDGKISDDMKALALYLRKPIGKVADIIQVLLDAQLLDETETGFTPHNWNGRQYKSDVSTERVKRFRGRFRNADETVNETPPEADTETEAKTERKKSAAPSRVVAVPDWIPSEEWKAYVEMRKKIRAPLTERAITLAIADLEKLKAQGHTPGAVLDQSTKRAWRGLFAIKADASDAKPEKANPMKLREDRERLIRLGKPTDKVDRAIEEAEARAA